MKKITLILLGISLLFILAGCAAVLVGAGIAGGMELGQDSARIAKDTSFANAYQATFKTLEEMGTVLSENKYAGKIEAEVRESKITAQIDRLTPKTVRIKITARKNVTFLPNAELAQEILNRVISKI